MRVTISEDEWRRHQALCLDFDVKSLRILSDEELAQAVASVEAGGHDGKEVMLVGRVLPICIEAVAIEVARRAAPGYQPERRRGKRKGASAPSPA